MAKQADVRKIALALPGAVESAERFAFGVEVKGKLKGFAWVWLERIHPKRGRVPNAGVLAVRVHDVGQKDFMIAADPKVFFTEPHYNGYPAILVRLSEIRMADLRALIQEAWECVTAKPRRR